ncbi:SDR family oxidoreductase [Corynebacterium minutissimum]|nr:SDR family oxidoreductase [Corynebacterium minutissimum]MCG7228812.1 SDR family oxidoreductase [Corynebacterium minutissimum]MCG7237929.1 SDR family oxidoreductase [Corynebacterium minutissimum]
MLVDVTSRDSVRNLYRDVIKRYGRIVILPLYEG